MTLEKKDWNKLLHFIRRGECVLVLGPSLPDYAGEASYYQELSRLLMVQAGIDCDPAQRFDFTEVYYRYLKSGRDVVDLSLDIERLCRSLDSRVLTLYRELAELPFRMCVNVGFDRQMAEACKQHSGRPSVHHYYDCYRGLETRHDENAEGASPFLVYNLLGDYSADTGSLVVTESQQSDSLRAIASNQPRLDSRVVEVQNDKQVSYLCIGFDFRSWYSRALFHFLKLNASDFASFAVRPESLVGHPDSGRITLFLEGSCDYVVDEGTLDVFVTQLRDRWREISQAVSRQPRYQSPDDSAPVVFLSYVHEDMDRVEWLEQQLYRNGVNTWRDDKLRAGDNWDRVLKDVIKSQCHYVVFCQSRNMDSASETYVSDEFDEAWPRHRRRDFNGEKFIFPARMDNCRGILRLADEQIQSRDVFDEEAAAALARDILDEWRIHSQRLQQE